jgi:hypothetical protein
MTVTIPKVPEHGGFDFNLITVTISDRCPVCGGPRGVPYKTLSYDGSRRLTCDGWRNPCRHVDLYSAVAQEATRHSGRSGTE